MDNVKNDEIANDEIANNANQYNQCNQCEEQFDELQEGYCERCHNYLFFDFNSNKYMTKQKLVTKIIMYRFYGTKMLTNVMMYYVIRLIQIKRQI